MLILCWKDVQVQEVVERYRAISERIADPVLLLQLQKRFRRTNRLEELLDWVHHRVTFEKGPILRHENPQDILVYGKGKCREFSILFTAVCLAHGYRARLILDLSDHAWTEVWNPAQKRWVHVDPSEKRIDCPTMYEREWKKKLKRELEIDYYARKFYERLSDERIDRIFDIIKSDNIAQDLLHEEDLSFDWHSKVVLRLMGHGALAKAFRMMRLPFRLRW